MVLILLMDGLRNGEEATEEATGVVGDDRPLILLLLPMLLMLLTLLMDVRRGFAVGVVGDAAACVRSKSAALAAAIAEVGLPTLRLVVAAVLWVEMLTGLN
jgi:hypothetical protein